MNELTISAAVQMVGSLAMLATISYLAHAVGPEAQGLFSSLKAEFDFFTAFLLLGLPQAIFFYVASKEQEWGQALTLAVVHALISLVIIGIWSAVAMYGSHANFPSIAHVIFFALAVAIGIFYADTRALVLAAQPAITFSIVTALPSAILLLVVLAGINYLADAGLSSSLIANPVVFVIAYSLATVVAMILVFRNFPIRFDSLATKSIVTSLRFGVATWVPAISQAGTILFAIRWLGNKPDSVDGIAGFSTAIALVLAVLTPLAMVIPIFFKWWAPLASEQRNAELAKSLGVILVLACLCFALVWLLEERLIRIMFGVEYVRFAGIYSAMAATILPQAAFRMWGVYCSSSGRPRHAAWLEAARLIIVIVCVLSYGVDLKSTVYAWIFAEYFALLLGTLFVTVSGDWKTPKSI